MATFDAVMSPNDSDSTVLEKAVEHYYNLSIVSYRQRVYSPFAGAWCYYTKTTIDLTPLSTETTPNHADDIVAGSHSVVAEL